jgi:hypothetical protein
MTVREKLVKGLEGAGWTRDWTARTRKYWVYRHTGFVKALYLGKAGAMRYGVTVAGAMTVEGFKRKLLAKVEREVTA